MRTQFNIKELFKLGNIPNELEYERALLADRKLRILSAKNPILKSDRKRLRDLIEIYEKNNWSGKTTISEAQFRESDSAEKIAEIERLFIERRKTLIKSRLKELSLKQQDLGMILGHKSKTYMSELMNGIYPFSIKDLVVINRLLEIELSDLVPTFLSHNDRVKLRKSIENLNNPHIKPIREDLAPLS